MSDFRNIPDVCLPNNAVFGCTYSSASNYNPNANVDDGSCVFSLGNTFDIQMYGLHFQECIVTTGEKEAFFIIEIPQIIAYNPVTSFDMFIQLYAYPYRYNNLSILHVSCNNTNPVYLDNKVSVNVENRLANQKKHIIHIDTLTPNFSMGFQVDENDSTFDFINETIDMEIKIISDGRTYSDTFTLPIDTYFSTPSLNIKTI